MTKEQAIQKAIQLWPDKAGLGKSIVSMRPRAPESSRYAVGPVMVGNWQGWHGYGATWEQALERAERVMRGTSVQS